MCGENPDACGKLADADTSGKTVVDVVGATLSSRGVLYDGVNRGGGDQERDVPGGRQIRRASSAATRRFRISGSLPCCHNCQQKRHFLSRLIAIFMFSVG